MRLHLLSLMRFAGRIRAQVLTAAVRRSFFSFGHKSVLIGPIRLAGTQHIQVGSGVTIGSNSWLQVVQPAEVDNSPTLQIGDGVSIAGYCTITARHFVDIGRKVLIARYVYISDHTHEICAGDLPIIDQGITGIAAVRIGEGAWLGQSVVVCPGVTIGRNAVIGANSVVRIDVPDYCIAAGAPARVIRRIRGAIPSSSPASG